MGSSGQHRRKKRASDIEVDEYAPVRARRARRFVIVTSAATIVIYVPILVWLVSEGIAGTLALGSLWVLAAPAPVFVGVFGTILLAQRNSTLRDNPLTWTQNL